MIGPKVTLELRRKTKTDDSIGSKTTTWEGKRKISGTLVTIIGDERLSADKQTVIETHNFYIDFPIGITITEEDIFYYGQRRFEIKDVFNIGANQDKGLKIILKEET